MKNGVNNTAPSTLEIQASSQKPIAIGNMYQNSNQYSTESHPLSVWIFQIRTRVSSGLLV